MPSTLWGLPTHPLVVHLVVFLVPLTVAATLVVALWPRARRVAAPWVLAVATVAVISVPMATSSGENLESRVPHSALVERHAELADMLLPLAGVMWLGLAVMTGVGWYARRESAAAPRWAGAVTVAAAVLAIGGAAASGVQVVRIGHSGANAVWHDVAAHPERR
ncbi:hypothetical protein GCM10009527_097330 [Actinomadura nitritigenes]|uniref:DUF2231 domain-containing protein n=1 Tax=Actinomadura nitritigenes TaxID=134602 RepID=A0ABS3RHH6_9ACTN|nr:DUF2231 domain-containing protein [Actinomadura nitritigenes]MBO2445073.1 hypothetical protein [Actinomadura nitritigenes]